MSFQENITKNLAHIVRDFLRKFAQKQEKRAFIIAIFVKCVGAKEDK